MKKLILTAIVFCMVHLAWPVAAQRVARPDPTRWEQEVQAFEAADAKAMPEPGGILFYGSSSVRMWNTLEASYPEYNIVRRGLGGSHMADAVYYADRMALRYEPRLVLVYEGDNDLADGLTPAEVLAEFHELVTVIQDSLPRTRIAFLAIKPSIARIQLMDEVRTTNNLIRAYTEADPRLSFVDTAQFMLGMDGNPRPDLFREDGLHLNEKGYAIWKQVVDPFLLPVP